nr:hypothetical protein B0A51_08822 [Rachicladosporium sp. CCFEE 5018]
MAYYIRALLITTFLLSLPLTYLLVWRLKYTLSLTRPKPIRHGRRNPREPTHLLIVLGSGGHTAEMIAMLERAVNSPSPQSAQSLDWRDFAHRTWVVGEDDELSATKAKEFEEMATSLTSQETLMSGKVRAYTDHGPGSYEIKKVPRARAIYQSPWTSPFSVLRCFLACWSILTHGVYPEDVSAMQHIPADTKGRDYPDIILVNGPATGTVMVLASVALRFFDYKGAATRFRMRTLYVESWARVKRLSLSGRILAHMVDRCLVQWPLLDAKKTGPGRAEFQGCFV